MRIDNHGMHEEIRRCSSPTPHTRSLEKWREFSMAAIFAGNRKSILRYFEHFFPFRDFFIPFWLNLPINSTGELSVFFIRK